jgi:cytochrome c oxidase cbb3-type subunit 3
VSEGQRLYQEFNCVECHAHGGGGIGPALIDEEWIYGSSSPQIVATLIQGRPNGMPSFRNILTEDADVAACRLCAAWRANFRKTCRPAGATTLPTTPPVTLEKKQPLHPSNDESGVAVSASSPR